MICDPRFLCEALEHILPELVLCKFLNWVSIESSKMCSLCQCYKLRYRSYIFRAYIEAILKAATPFLIVAVVPKSFKIFLLEFIWSQRLVSLSLAALGSIYKS